MLDENQQITFTRLWTDVQPAVTQYVASLVRDHWAVRDIVQNTSLTLLRKFTEYDDKRSFLPWALGTAKYEILGYQRDSARSRMVFDTEFLEEYTQAWAKVVPRFRDHASALRQCIDQLDGQPKKILSMRYADNQPSPVIASELGLTSVNVRAILKRTRNALQRCVEKQLALRGGLE